MADWIPVIGTVLGMIVGGILGAGLQELRFREERKQKYRVMTFDKRLDTHQQAFHWCQELNQILNTGEPKEIHEVSVKARKWWNNNCLFLDKYSRTKMIGLFNLAHSFANEKQRPVQQEVRLGDAVWNRLDESFKAIMEGIGTEYLPEMKSNDTTGKD